MVWPGCTIPWQSVAICLRALYQRSQPGEPFTINGQMKGHAFMLCGGQGGYIGVHSGGWKAGIDGEPRPGHIVPRPGELAAPTQLDTTTDGASDPQWACTLVSIILALNDIGPGDGPTVKSLAMLCCRNHNQNQLMGSFLHDRVRSNH